MLISRNSIHSGIVRTWDIPITEEQIKKLEGGALIQDAFPHISPAQREWLMTGLTPSEWDELFAPDITQGGQ